MKIGILSRNRELYSTRRLVEAGLQSIPAESPRFAIAMSRHPTTIGRILILPSEWSSSVRPVNPTALQVLSTSVVPS